MRSKFLDILTRSYPNLQSSTLLVAVSGGVDSMVLVDLLKNCGISFVVAHCNFMLRGEESNQDAQFVEEYCTKYSIIQHSIAFDTTTYAQTHKQSTQIAARELRYHWFDQLMQENGYTHLATAHHLDDSLETFLINFTRGTGMEGLLGIQQTDKIIRPLLSFTRDEILSYAKANGLVWREDSSNASDKYLRNKIRHHIIPTLKEINPTLLDNFNSTLTHLNQASGFAQEMATQVLSEWLEQKGDQQWLPILKLKSLTNYSYVLYQWLSDYGFTAWEDIYNLVDSQSGKQIFSPTHVLLKDRSHLILSAQAKMLDTESYFIDEDSTSGAIPISIRLQDVAMAEEDFNENVIYVDKNLLNFPLQLQKWSEGDYFCPKGMGGKRKKVSKFFKDEKFTLFQKQETWILKSAGEVIWIVSHRQDERFTVKPNTRSILKIEYIL